MKILTLPPINGPQVISRVMATRWRSIVASIVLAILLAVAGLFAHGVNYTATTSVEVASVSVEPNSTTRGTNGVDMTSELALVRSGRTAQRASELVEGSVSAEDIINGLTASGANNSNIITITWTDENPDRARQVSAAVAQAYLDTRVELILGRLAAITEEINKEIAQREEALAKTNDDSPAALATKDSLRSAITALNTRLASLVGFNAPNGRVITPDSAVPLIQGPSKKNVFAGALGVGLFLGMIIAVLRERFDAWIRDARQLAHVVSAPVWSQDKRENEELRWYGAARMATLIGKDRGVLALLIGSSQKDAPLLISALSAAQSDLRPDQHLRVMDLDGHRADLLQSLSDVDQVVIAPGATMKVRDISQLVDQIDLSGCELTGAFYIPAS